ncbi:MAG: hypothetical protein H0X02_00090 [Nitrosomonas sp.]|nr:hypothetical protein [Nitrosomonas sp.]
MKTNQITIITIAALLLFTLIGCGDNVDGDGKIVLKEPKKELSEMPERKNWSVTDVEGWKEESPAK